MGILFVLIFYAIALTALATVSAAVLWLGARRYLRSAPARTPLLIAAAFPFACVLFAGTWFVAYAVVNQIVFHHDPGLGDGWYTPVGHGYAIDMIDITDFGYLHPEGNLNGPGSIAGVLRLQLVGDEAFGTEDTNALQHEGTGHYGEDGFFHLQMSTHATIPFPSEGSLAAYAANEGISLRLRPVVQIFNHFRWCWFDYLAGSVLLLGPVAGVIGLLSYLRRFKRIASGSVAM